MSRALKIGFTLSLALNLLLIGVLIGLAFKKLEGGSARKNFPTPMMLLPESTKEKHADLLRSHQEANRAQMLQMMESGDHILALLREEQFDAGQMRQFFEAVSAHHRAFQAQMFDGLVRISGQMSWEERKAFADALERKSQKMRSMLRAKGEHSPK